MGLKIALLQLLPEGNLGAQLSEEPGVRDMCILEAPEQEGIYLAEIDMDMLREYRAHEVMCDKYRHPNVYGLLATEGKR